VASLILGIFSLFCFGLLTGLPAIVLGHMAHSRARRVPQQYGGAGLAIAGFVMGYASVITTLVLAGLFLPALAKAKSRAQSIACVNNLKQIGLGFRIFATDHEGRFPFHSSTNATEAAAEAAVRDEFAAPESVVFQRLARELNNPKILVCPADSSKRPAASMETLGPENISYEIETGPEVNESNPQEVLARCPIHGHELLCDGSVHR
jgi:hypothetical protein